VLPPEVTENAGVVAVSVNATVVDAVVPKEGTPPENTNGVFTTPAVVVGDAGAVKSFAAICTCAVPPPSLHATRVLATRRVAMRLRIFFMVGTFRLAWHMYCMGWLGYNNAREV